MKDVGDVIAEHPFFAGMPEQDTRLVAGCGQLSSYEPGELLARAGSEAESFFLVRKGRVALELTPPGRDPFLLGSVAAGDVFGWSWLFEPHVWQFDARALDRTSVIRFDGACLRGKCDEDPRFGYGLMKRFAGVLVQRFADTRLQLMDVYGARS